MKTKDEIIAQFQEILNLDEDHIANFAAGIGIDGRAALEAIVESSQTAMVACIAQIRNGEIELAVVNMTSFGMVGYLAGILEGREIKAEEQSL